jgi:hypothetical protein
VTCGIADERYKYVQKIFDIIEPLIPESDNDISPALEKMIKGMKTHGGESSSMVTNQSKGKDAVITRRLFTDENGETISPDSISGKIEAELQRFLYEKNISDEKSFDNSYTINYSGDDYDCSNINKNIKIQVNKPKVNRNLRKAYQNIISKYMLTINSYTTRLGNYLKGSVDEFEYKKYFGSGLSSRYFADIKKRFWYRKSRDEDIPDVSFLIMIDGSGSMNGERNKTALESSIILHEVLKSNQTEHAIVEHRAIYGEPQLIHNILIDFNARAEESYNLLSLDAKEGTREGLTLFWAENYIQKQSSGEFKIIIMISDGAPEHSWGESVDYTPPVSIKDTAYAAKKIIHRGTPIIAIAIDTPDDSECYEQLKQIYPNVVSCTDLSKLTGQLLAVVSKSIQGSQN